MRGRLASAAAALLVVAAGCGAADAPQVGGEPDDALLVGAASDLRPAFELIGERFTTETGTELTFDFGSSGQVAQRIVEGQPVDLFASANAGFVDEVLAADVGDPTTRTTYAFGRIVLWADEDRWAGWKTLEDAVADEDVRNFAIANPDHAPYGAAGREALVATGTYRAVEDRLVLGENISDTQRLIETGNADVGIIALSLALAADERDAGEWFLLDDDLHAPLQQDLVVTTADPGRAERAAAFVEFVAGEEGRAVMQRFGFLLPGEELGS